MRAVVSKLFGQRAFFVAPKPTLLQLGFHGHFSGLSIHVDINHLKEKNYSPYPGGHFSTAWRAIFCVKLRITM